MPTTPPASHETEALNLHGVFLKKRVAEELRNIQSLRIFSEEFGVSFESSTAIDLVALVDPIDLHGSGSKRLWFVLECKRAYAKQKKWLFFRDQSSRFRQFRFFGVLGPTSIMQGRVPDREDRPICSEGIEITNVDGKYTATPDPIYNAGNQLSRGYLGFASHLFQKLEAGAQMAEPNTQNCVIPILVTTAAIHIANFDINNVSLVSGNLEGNFATQPADWLILKHPFSVPHANAERDFRYKLVGNEINEWNQQFRESIFVVQANKLQSFFSRSNLDWFRDN